MPSRLPMSYAALLVTLLVSSALHGAPAPSRAEVLQAMIDATQPLKFPRGQRLPLFAFPAQDVPLADEAAARALLQQLGERGIGVFATWNYGDKDKSLAAGLKIARLQKALGLPVAVSAISVMGGFYNGDPSTAHVDSSGKPFFDKSQTFIPLGCPFAVQSRYPAVRQQIDFFTGGYKQAGVEVDFAFADFEFDGPLEWGDAWEMSKRCARCREHISKIDGSFPEFQKAVRTIRAELQKKVFADPLREAFPHVLVGNYGVYPNDGFRYWYDFFEKVPPPPAGVELKQEQAGKFRPWFQEFPLTDYTFAMPVVFPRYRTFNYCEDANTDYRWFRGLLLNASNAGKSTPADVPLVSWVCHQITDAPKPADPAVIPMSDTAYRELLWHMFLRGHDDLFVFCGDSDAAAEIKPVQEVYAGALQYKDFLDKGVPVAFVIPDKAGPVVSALKLGEKMLVRRTDFTADNEPVVLKFADKSVSVPRMEGKCQIIQVE